MQQSEAEQMPLVCTPPHSDITVWRDEHITPCMKRNTTTFQHLYT